MSRSRLRSQSFQSPSAPKAATQTIVSVSASPLLTWLILISSALQQLSLYHQDFESHPNLWYLAVWTLSTNYIIASVLEDISELHRTAHNSHFLVTDTSAALAAPQGPSDVLKTALL